MVYSIILTCSILSGHTSYNKNVLLMNYMDNMNNMNNIPFKELEENNKKEIKNEKKIKNEYDKINYKNQKNYFIKHIMINRKLKLFH